MRPRLLIKIGGAALVDPTTLTSVAIGLKKCLDEKYQVIVVHGGGPAINEELTRRGLSWTFVNGQRVTSPEMIQIIKETLTKTVNSNLVKALRSSGLMAQGFSGAEHETLFCRPLSPELGLVGEVQTVNSLWLNTLMAANPEMIPVIAPIGIGGDGQYYNINADGAASHLAVSLKVDRLIFLTDQEGVWDENKNILTHLSLSEIDHHMETGSFSGGMFTKIKAVSLALKKGVNDVFIAHGKNSDKLLTPLMPGTLCQSLPSLQNNPVESYDRI